MEEQLDAAMHLTAIAGVHSSYHESAYTIRRFGRVAEAIHFVIGKMGSERGSQRPRTAGDRESDLQIRSRVRDIDSGERAHADDRPGSDISHDTQPFFMVRRGRIDNKPIRTPGGRLQTKDIKPRSERRTNGGVRCQEAIDHKTVGGSEHRTSRRGPEEGGRREQPAREARCEPCHAIMSP